MIKELHKLEGFTLIELMVTIAVAAVLLSVAVPSFQHMAQNNAVRATTSDLISTFNLARQHSISLRQDVKVAPKEGGWGKGWVVDLKDEQSKVDYKPRAGVIVEHAQGESSPIVFSQNGGIGSAKPIFTVAHENADIHAKKICLSFLGKVTQDKDCK